MSDGDTAGSPVPTTDTAAGEPTSNLRFRSTNPLNPLTRHRRIAGMNLTIALAFALLGLLQMVAFVYLRRTNRRLDALTVEIREEIAAGRQEMQEMCRATNQRLEEVAEEMRERIRAANRRLDESIEARRLIDDITDPVHCLKAPGGTPKRLRRSDHRQ